MLAELTRCVLDEPSLPPSIKGRICDHGALRLLALLYSGATSSTPSPKPKPNPNQARNVHGVPLETIGQMRARYQHDWRRGDPQSPNPDS